MAKNGDTTVMLDEEEPRTSGISMRIPPFWPEEPELWFAQLEGQLALCKVTKDHEKFVHALSKIEPRQAKEVKDVIIRPPKEGKYEALKRALIQRLTDSQEHRIRKLLETEELGDRKPSQFLRHLDTLAGTTVPPELLRTLWLSRLPTQTQAILATRKHDDLEKVAEQADRIHEIGNTLAVQSSAVKPTDATHDDNLTKLQQQVAALTQQVSDLANRWQSSRRAPRSRSRSRERPSTLKISPTCFYHQRFGEKARKCAPPCNFTKRGNSQGSH